MGSFFERIAAERTHNKAIPPVLKSDKSFRVQAAYLADRRFASGPLPFSLEAVRGEEKIMFGNFLIYPDVMDIRGSAEVDPALAGGIASFFDINADHMDRNFIRLDSNLAPMFGLPAPATQEQSAQQPQP